MEGRACPGLSYLKKEQLNYELAVRRMTCDGSVGELAARLRKALDQPIVISEETVGEVGPSLDNISVALSDVDRSVKGFEGNSPTRKQLSRLQAQSAHLFNRVGDILKLELSQQQREQATQLCGRVKELQLAIACLNLQCSDSESESQKDCLEAGGVASPSNVGVGRCNESYAKLPHPLLNLLQGISVLSVESLDQIEVVLWLSARLERHVNVLAFSHLTVLRLLYPLAQGSLIQILTRVLDGQGTLRELREIIIREKLPSRLRDELREKYYSKLQGKFESLGEYIERVELAVVALNMMVSGEDLVRHIWEGLKPEDRGRIGSSRDLSTRSELQARVISAERLRLLDDHRDLVDRTEATLHRSTPQPLPRDSTDKRLPSGRRCFGCGSKSHMVRDCNVKHTKPRAE